MLVSCLKFHDTFHATGSCQPNDATVPILYHASICRIPPPPQQQTFTKKKSKEASNKYCILCSLHTVGKTGSPDQCKLEPYNDCKEASEAALLYLFQFQGLKDLVAGQKPREEPKEGKYEYLATTAQQYDDCDDNQPKRFQCGGRP